MTVARTPLRIAALDGLSAAMFDAVVRDEQHLDEQIHAGRTARLLVQSLELEAEGDAPPLAVERTVLPGGATRPPVILVHGLAQNRYTWRLSGRSMSGALAEQGHEVLNLELRGHGNSRRYGAGNASRFEEYVDDLVRVIRRCEEPPFLVGHSLGAAVCIGAATEVEVRGLVHLAGVFTFARRNRTLRALARASLGLERWLLMAPVRMSTGWAGDLIAKLYAVTDIAGYGAPIAGWAPDSIERELLEERLRLGFDWSSVEVWMQMSRWALGEQLVWAERYCALDLPLLVIVGDQDPLVRPADGRALYNASCSTDRQFLLMEPFEHEVHWGHIDLIIGRKAPDEVWPRIASWFAAR